MEQACTAQSAKSHYRMHDSPVFTMRDCGQWVMIKMWPIYSNSKQEIFTLNTVSDTSAGNLILSYEIHVLTHLNPPGYFIPTDDCPFLSYFWYNFLLIVYIVQAEWQQMTKAPGFNCGITQKHLPKCHFALFTGVPLDGLSLPPPELGPITRSRRAAERTAHSPHHQVSSSISVTNKEEFWNMANKTKNALKNWENQEPLYVY